MKSRAFLNLMEQLIMVLVFALAAALCLQVFAKADSIAARTDCLDKAVLIAQNTAEGLKHTGDPATVDILPEDSHFTVDIREEATDIPGFAKANVTASCDCGETFCLTVGWQEVAP